MPAPSALAADGLVKNNLAERLRAEIISGALPPGARIVEGKWAPRFGVAQGSIREAIIWRRTDSSRKSPAVVLESST